MILDIVHKDEYFMVPPADDMPFVNRVASEHWGPRFRANRHFVSNVFIAFIRQGRARLIQSDGEDETIGPGRVMYLAPKIPHRIEACEEGVSLIVILLAGDAALEMVGNYMPPNPMGMSLADPGRVESLFYRLLEVGEKKGIHTPRIASALVEPLLLTIDQEYRSHAESTDGTFALFTRCRNHIENNWREIGSVSEVPRALGISQPYMGRLFKTYENSTPHQFLLRQKMTYALYELQNSETTITRLAYDLGFADPYSFSKTFKRMLGVAPSNMRLGKTGR